MINMSRHWIKRFSETGYYTSFSLGRFLMIFSDMSLSKNPYGVITVYPIAILSTPILNFYVHIGFFKKTIHFLHDFLEAGLFFFMMMYFLLIFITYHLMYSLSGCAYFHDFYIFYFLKWFFLFVIYQKKVSCILLNLFVFP